MKRINLPSLESGMVACVRRTRKGGHLYKYLVLSLHSSHVRMRKVLKMHSLYLEGQQVSVQYCSFIRSKSLITLWARAPIRIVRRRSSLTVMDGKYHCIRREQMILLFAMALLSAPAESK